MPSIYNTYYSEIDFIRKWCNTILDYLATKSADFKHFSDLAKVKFQHDHDKLDKNILNGYKEAFREVNQMTKYLPSEDFIELSNLLNEKFGKTLSANVIESEKVIKRIIKRNKINNPKEYRIVMERVDEIYLSTSDSDKNEVGVLNNLLLLYYQTHKV